MTNNTYLFGEQSQDLTEWYDKQHGQSPQHLQDSCTSIDAPKRVRFAAELVSEVRERPRTLPEERSELFYSRREMHQFREELRQFRRQQAQLRRLHQIQQNGGVSPTTSLSSTSKSTSSILDMLYSTVKRNLFVSTDSNKTPDTLLLVDTLYLF